MGRRLGLVAAIVAALAFSGDAGALSDWHTVRITPGGPVPRTVTVSKDVSAVAWVNRGTHGTRIVFTDSSCRAPISSERRLFSPTCVTGRVGRHAYRIVGLTGPDAWGVVVVRPLR